MNWERYDSAVHRNLAELNNAILKRRALIGINNSNSAHGLDFFRIAQHALYNDLVAHALRVFDLSKKAASFWYIVNCDLAMAKKAARTHRVQLKEIESISNQLKIIRYKTHFHIDREAVTDPRQVWSLAHITGDYLGTTLDGAFNLLSEIKYKRTGMRMVVPDYDGSDVPKIIRAYKHAHPEAHIAV